MQWDTTHAKHENAYTKRCTYIHFQLKPYSVDFSFPFCRFVCFCGRRQAACSAYIIVQFAPLSLSLLLFLCMPFVFAVATTDDSPVAMKLKKMWLKTPITEEQASQTILDPSIGKSRESSSSSFVSGKLSCRDWDRFRWLRYGYVFGGVFGVICKEEQFSKRPVT